MDWSNMPDELLGLIISNIFTQDRYAFNLVCKSWNNFVTSSRLYCDSPWLVSTNRISQFCKVIQYNTCFYMNFLKPDLNPVIRCSKHGWLLVSQDDKTLFFFDPFNNHKIQLPGLPGVYTTVTFFHPPTSPDCFIVGITSLTKNVEIGLLRHGDDEWSVDYMPSLRKHNRFKTSLAHPVLFGGKLYFVDVKGNIATIDMSEDPIVDSGFVYRKCVKQRRFRRSIKQHFLIKPKDEDAIFAVFARKGERDVKVFRLLDMDYHIHWEPVNDLGDRVFYVSNASSFGYKTDKKCLANKIFFPKLHGDHQVMFYSMETHKFHSFGGDYFSENSNDFKRIERASWITPPPTPRRIPGELLRWCSEEII